MESTIDTTNSTIETPLSTDVEKSPPIQNKELEPINARKVLTKIDLRLLPILSLGCLLAFLDRISIGNAEVYGLSKDLNMEGTQFNVALLIFFIPYILLEIPSNMLLKKFKPHCWIAFNIAGFGLTTLSQGFIKNYRSLLVTRFFLGVFESEISGCYYLISMWYLRSEAQKRFSVFFLNTALAIAFGGLLATAIGKMDGLAGITAWRWIFIVEGSMTVIVGVVGWWIIPDFPEDPSVTWLTSAEKKWVQNRLEDDVGKSGRDIKIPIKDIFKMIFTDYKFIMGALMYFFILMPASGYAYFSPIILRGWNYSQMQSQLLSVPIGLVTYVVGLITAWLSDRYTHKYYFVMSGVVSAMIGISVIMATHGQRLPQYAMLFFIFVGLAVSVSIVIGWFQSNLAGHKQRAIGSAWQISMGNIGSAISTFLFVKKDAPDYVFGYTACLVSVALGGICATIYLLGIKRENRVRDKIPEGQDVDGEIGDHRRNFKYIE